MFTKWIIKTFIKDADSIEKENVRNQYGYVAGLVGIIANLALFGVKLSVGFISGSIAVTADAFNNFSDMASSIITMIGFKMASRPADKEHPFGHGRVEYLSALLVAFMVMLVGVEFIKSSVSRIFNPSPIIFEWIPFILLGVSVLVKMWLSRFNKSFGEKINSSALKATAVDAMGDVFTSSCVLLSFLLSRFTDIPIDGFAGLIVAAAILYAGYNLVKETISPLLGEAPDPDLVSKIYEKLLSFPEVTGVHDLIVHNYGVGKIMASIHAEIPSNIDIMTIHEVIDDAERTISDDLNIYLVIHMDPVAIETEEITRAKEELELIIDAHPAILSMHDFRIVGKEPSKNLIFDLVVDVDELGKGKNEEIIKEHVMEEMRKTHPDYRFVITIDRSFQ